MEYTDPVFFQGDHLISELVKLIEKSNKRLILISPYIDLSHSVKTALGNKLNDLNLKLIVLFGKNSDNLSKSIKPDSLEFLMQFPNIQIYHEPRLHIKYYENDYDFIITSLNLYDYSQYQNLEIGVKFNYSSKSIFGKLSDKTFNALDETVSTIKSKVISGEDPPIDPRAEMERIIKSSNLLFSSTTKKSKNIFQKNSESERTIEINKIAEYFNSSLKVKQTGLQESISENLSNIKSHSASFFSKKFNVSIHEIKKTMTQNGLIKNNEITAKGKLHGLTMKKIKDKDYIAYPENLDILKSFQKQ